MFAFGLARSTSQSAACSDFAAVKFWRLCQL